MAQIINLADIRTFEKKYQHKKDFRLPCVAKIWAETINNGPDNQFGGYLALCSTLNRNTY